MSDVARLRAELALAELAEVLEAAREAVHADKTPANIEAYRAASAAAAAARSEFRTNFAAPVPKEGDAVAKPGTVAAEAEAKVKEE